MPGGGGTVEMHTKDLAKFAAAISNGDADSACRRHLFTYIDGLEIRIDGAS